jgi:hypothetical protein
MRKLSLTSIALLFAACSGAKPDVTESFDDLAGLDEKSDAFSSKMKIVGSLDYGQTSKRISYTGSPRFAAFKFGGHEGDKISVDVRSDDGDPITWVLDNGFHVVGKNDDATKRDTNSHIEVTLPPNASATHYIVFRDFDVAPAHFTVDLKVLGGDFFACKTDKDCIAVPTVGCCNNGYKTAVNVDEIDAYEASFTCPQEHPICPLFIINDTRAAECNVGKHACEMVAIDQIKCGGFTTNPHACPEGYECQFGNIPDVPGTCVESKVCVQNVECIQGSHWDLQACKCVADPKDNCGGCAKGQYCSLCWGHWACIPNGALC